MNCIYNYSKEKLELKLKDINEKPFRATQIFEWIYKKNSVDFDSMSNISKNSIEKLKKEFDFGDLEIEKVQTSSDGTKKYLFRLNDNELIETVLMQHNYGYSVCVSTQVGCNMNCSFCASGMNKKKRNLETYEMVLQVLKINELSEERVSHVVVMGIGEPFDNYDNVMEFIRIINDAKGLEIGSRHITVSTCGLVPKIKDFSDFGLQVNLAISLHFASNEKRNLYMPINKTYPLEQLIDAINYYYDKTNRRITFEYILIDSINDTPTDAHMLVNLIRGLNCYVNLIPLNKSNGLFKRSSKDNTNKFYEILVQSGINATLRKEQGHDIDAACGQLRINSMKGNE